MEPRRETFCFTMKSLFCPTMSFKSFILYILVIIWTLYFVSLFWHGVSNQAFLAPTNQALYTLGMK